MSLLEQNTIKKEWIIYNTPLPKPKKNLKLEMISNTRLKQLAMVQCTARSTRLKQLATTQCMAKKQELTNKPLISSFVNKLSKKKKYLEALYNSNIFRKLINSTFYKENLKKSIATSLFLYSTLSMARPAIILKPK